MIDGPIAHVGGIPIEETIGSFGPALVVGVGVAWATLRDRLRSREPARTAGPVRAGSETDTRTPGGACSSGPGTKVTRTDASRTVPARSAPH